MNTQPFVLLTIVTEAVLESTIAADILRLGARGYTVTDARGSGSHGVRSGAWGGRAATSASRSSATRT